MRPRRHPSWRSDVSPVRGSDRRTNRVRRHAPRQQLERPAGISHNTLRFFASRRIRRSDARAALCRSRPTVRPRGGSRGRLRGIQGVFRRPLQSTPGVVRRRYLTLLAFRVRDSNGVQQWLVDPATRRVSEVGALPEDCIVFEVHAAVVNDCARLKMFSVWTASKRLKIHLPSAAHLKFANLWMTILDLYEVDLLPLRKNFSKRALGVRLRRWREPVEVANILFRSRVLRRPFSVATIYPIPST